MITGCRLMADGLQALGSRLLGLGLEGAMDSGLEGC